jgi:hypothetical protein
MPDDTVKNFGTQVPETGRSAADLATAYELLADPLSS